MSSSAAATSWGSLGFGGLLLVRFAAGADEAVGEKPLERVFAP